MFKMLIPLIVPVALAFAAPASAQSVDDMVTVSVLPGWRMQDGSHMAALRFEMEPGWKTYWRAPGDAGIPPRFDWRGSSNLKTIEIIWPTPQQTMTSGLRTIGYEHDLVLPVRLTPDRADQPISLAAEIEIGLCSDICVPVQMETELPLGPGERDPRIAAALAARPYTAEEAGVGRVACTVAPLAGGGMRLVAEIEMKQMGAQEMVVVETGNPQLWIAHTDTQRTGQTLQAETELHHVEGLGFMLDRSGLRFTVLSTGDAVDIRGCAAPDPA
jgi:DsbC/DsbD-like thiol-disulfide interchange protein